MRARLLTNAPGRAGGLLTSSASISTIELALVGALRLSQPHHGHSQARRSSYKFGGVRENAMTFQPVIDTVEIDVIYDLHGATVQNVFYAALVGGYTLADLTALAAAIDLEVNATWLPLQPIEAFYTRTEVRGLAIENDLLVTNSVSAGIGADPSSTLPNNVTFAVKKESGFTGRSARGRTYWIGIPQTKIKTVNENELTTSYAANVVTAIDTIRTRIIATGAWTPVLVSRFNAGVARSAGMLFPWIGCSSVNEQIDTQRGRMP